MDDQELYVYRVFDTKTETYWKAPGGKVVWNAPGHAKNSWNSARCYGDRSKFNDQSRYVIHKFKLERVVDDTD